MSVTSVEALRQEFLRLSEEAHARFAVSHGLWEAPEFAAVREAMDLAETEAEHDYYMAWFLRLVEGWNPLHEATRAAQRAAEAAHREWVTARDEAVTAA